MPRPAYAAGLVRRVDAMAQRRQAFSTYLRPAGTSLPGPWDTMDFEFRSSAPRPRAATPGGVWFDNAKDRAPRAGRKTGTSPSRTSLVPGTAGSPADPQVLRLVKGLPPAGPLALPAYAVGVLNEAGQVYREVWLWDVGEALVFTARMNAAGFGQVRAADPASPYDSLFTRL